MNHQDTIKQYAQAWNLRTEADIRAALAECWADTGSYTDPATDPIVGVDALARHIHGFTQQFPDAALAPTSAVDTHHLVGRFSWVITSPTPMIAGGDDLGTEIPGLDFVEFTEDGRIQRIVGFFG